MKIVIVSDNHGVNCLQEIQNRHYDADYFVHCGDSEFPQTMLSGFACVRGNNDYYSRTLPDSMILDFKEHRALVVHGHLFSYMYMKKAMADVAKRNGCDMVFYGHTHRFDYSIEDNVTFINPGSLYRNRDYSAPCYVVLSINGNEIEVKRFEL